MTSYKSLHPVSTAPPFDESWNVFCDMANLCTEILDFRGFDSSILWSLRGGVLMSMGNFPEGLSERILAGILLVERLGIGIQPRWTRCNPVTAPSNKVLVCPGYNPVYTSWDWVCTSWDIQQHILCIYNYIYIYIYIHIYMYIYIYIYYIIIQHTYIIYDSVLR